VLTEHSHAKNLIRPDADLRAASIASVAYICLYLTAIVLANLSVAHFGPASTPVNALLFIGLDLTTRDHLHEAWGGRWLWPKMLTLIAVGSLLSWLLNRNAGHVAIASFVAFAASGMVDAVVYQLLHRQPWFVKINGSNVVSAATDSLLFPTIAFGTFMPLIVLGQFAAKVGGGFLWALVLRRTRKDAALAALGERLA